MKKQKAVLHTKTKKTTKATAHGHRATHTHTRHMVGKTMNSESIARVRVGCAPLQLHSAVVTTLCGPRTFDDCKEHTSTSVFVDTGVRIDLSMYAMYAYVCYVCYVC